MERTKKDSLIMAQDSNNILLTGAGFTANFDGFLGREMWSKIFNNPIVQNTPDVRELLLKDFDFESVYSSMLIGSAYNSGVKEVLKYAVEKAYKDLDETIKSWRFTMDNPTALDTYRLGELLSLIAQKGSDKGCFFTLNQDLFMERQFNWRSPGAAFGSPFIEEEGALRSITLPDDAGLEKAKSHLNSSSYIKLHGSYGWLSSRGGTQQMVIGRNKAEDINREPLLRWYFSLFEEVIYEGNKKMLIIGYGFRDEHVNNILLKGVQEHGLSLYVINPSDPEKFKDILEGRPSVPAAYEISQYSKIWNGVRGYFPYSLREIYPPDQKGSTVADELKKILTT